MENASLWSKKLDELTVGDYVKINAAFLGACVATGVAALAYDKAQQKYLNWKLERVQKNYDDSVEALNN